MKVVIDTNILVSAVLRDRDPELVIQFVDAIFLSCAISSDADFLLTGDTDLFQGENLLNTAVITVAEFKDLFCDVP